MAKKTRHQWEAEKPEGAAEQELRPSRSEKKRQSNRVAKLGVRLTELSPKILARLELDDELRTAIETGRGLKRGGARARQFRFIAKLLRGREVEEITAALEELSPSSRDKG